MTQPRVQFALNFPQGHILFLDNQGAYFLPHHSTDAFQIWGERKELFGKNAINVRGDRTTGTESYSVVHENLPMTANCSTRAWSAQRPPSVANWPMRKHSTT